MVKLIKNGDKAHIYYIDILKISHSFALQKSKIMSPAEIYNKLENKEEIILLDIREPEEVAICQIENSMHIPMMQILDRLDDLPIDKPIVLYCHLGVRSVSVINYLMSNNNYTNLINLDGGIENWAVTLEPSMSRY